MGGGLHAGREGSRGATTNLIEWVGEQRMNERMNERIKGRGSICHRPPASELKAKVVQMTKPSENAGF